MFNTVIIDDHDMDVDLRSFSSDQASILLDIVLFDAFLDYVYGVLLKRKPDREGRDTYRHLANNGLTRPEIVRSVLLSRECRDNSIYRRNLALDEFLKAAYQDILGRWPDSEGLETYSRIGSTINGRRKVIKRLLRSDEAARRGGGRLARVEALRTYVKANRLAQLPVLGRWLSRQHNLKLAFGRIAANQILLNKQVERLRREIELAGLGQTDPFGFIAEAQDVGMSNMMFQKIFNRAKRDA